MSSEPRQIDEVASLPGEPIERASDPIRGALRSPASWARFAIMAVGGLALDLWSKEWAFHTLRQGARREIIPHVFEFQTMLNPGALFGIGRGQTEVFLVASVLALLLVGWMFSQTSPRSRLLQIALGGILAGALGNMYDRVFIRLADKFVNDRGTAVFVTNTGRTEDGRWIMEEYPVHQGGVRRIWNEKPNDVGYVRDFLKIPTKWFGGKEVWPWVFNVADMLLVGGVTVLALHLLRHPREEQPSPLDASASPAP